MTSPYKIVTSHPLSGPRLLSKFNQSACLKMDADVTIADNVKPSVSFSNADDDTNRDRRWINVGEEVSKNNTTQHKQKIAALVQFYHPFLPFLKPKPVYASPHPVGKPSPGNSGADIGSNFGF